MRLQVERRAEPRRRVRESATLQLLRPRCGDRIPVQILDASQNGICVETPEVLPPGALVQIRLGRSVVLMGDVRYTVRRNTGFVAGVRLEDIADCRSIRGEAASTLRSGHLVEGQVPVSGEVPGVDVKSLWMKA